jgi:hypothetical protein
MAQSLIGRQSRHDSVAGRNNSALAQAGLVPDRVIYVEAGDVLRAPRFAVSLCRKSQQKCLPPLLDQTRKEVRSFSLGNRSGAFGRRIIQPQARSIPRCLFQCPSTQGVSGIYSKEPEHVPGELKGPHPLALEESMASCRRTLGEPKQNTGHWEGQVTAVGAFSNEIGSTSVVVCLETVCHLIRRKGCDIMVVLRNTISPRSTVPGSPSFLSPAAPHFSFARLVLHVSWHGSSGIE